jgi:hypothetical protein
MKLCFGMDVAARAFVIADALCATVPFFDCPDSKGLQVVDKFPFAELEILGSMF